MHLLLYEWIEMMSSKPRKQRKQMYNAPLHLKRKFIGAHLEENLLLKYDKRAIPVVKGDTVRVMRGSFRGHEDKIVRVDVKKRYIEIEGITMSKADGNKIAKPIHSSNVIITKLNLTDKWRRKKLERGLSEDTKKEIEAEAKEQIKVAEEEKKKEEEAKKLMEEKEEAEVEEPEIVEEKPETKTTPVAKQKKEEKPVKEIEKPKEKQEPKPTSKPKPKKEEVKEKKPTSTKPTQKKTTKKTPAKTTKKKEDKK
jgi:large subunit ribosomal protein L24